MLNLLSPLYFPKQATFLGASASVGHLENALGWPPWWCRPPDVRQGCCAHEAWGPTLMTPTGKALCQHWIMLGPLLFKKKSP